MNAKNLVFWSGLSLLLLTTVLVAATAGPAVHTATPALDQVAGLPLAGTGGQAKICINLMCPDGTPRDEFCRCPICTTSDCAPVPADETAPASIAGDKSASLWSASMDAPPRPCPDVMCPDGSPPDEYCRCRPTACIDLICPDGSPRDKFCRCPICTGSECAPVFSTDTTPAQPGCD